MEQTRSLSNPDVLPYLRAAVSSLFAAQASDNELCWYPDKAAQLLLEGLAQHGLTITPSPVVVAEPGPPDREPRRIKYTLQESNKLLEEALAQAWPQVSFFVRTELFCTRVYYMEEGAAPSGAEVHEFAQGFAGFRWDEMHCQIPIEHPRIGPDGYPEIVIHGTEGITVCPVVQWGTWTYRPDGRTNLQTITDYDLQGALLKTAIRNQ